MKYFNLLVRFITIITFVKAEFIYSCTEKNTIALTFDDGPHKYTRELVDYLRSQNDVKATFFTVATFHYPYATNVKEYQEAMKLAHDSGFQIASHTYRHKISEDKNEFKKSLTDNDDFIEKVTGDRPRYFRAPKGHCDKSCQAHLDEWGYRLIQWDSDTKDWDLETSGSIEQRVEDSINFLKKKFAEERDSYLILMHDSQNYTVSKIAPWIIEKSGMREKGYRFVTVAECLGHKDDMYASGKTYNKKIDENNKTTTVEKDKTTTVEKDKTTVRNSSTTVGNDTTTDRDANIAGNNTNVVLDNISNVDNAIVTDNQVDHNLNSNGTISIKPTFILTILSIIAYCALFSLIDQL